MIFCKGRESVVDCLLASTSSGFVLEIFDCYVFMSTLQSIVCEKMSSSVYYLTLTD
uniref:Uncharacterized protein n=1 Tax=Arion vulgaris TaxID=1028688 RepID=A0A0B7B9P9_9EUPU